LEEQAVHQSRQVNSLLNSLMYAKLIVIKASLW